MSWMSLAGGGFAVERFDAHAGHQPADPLTADGVAFTSEYVAQHPAAGKWMHHVHLVESAHQRPIGFRHWARPVIRGGTGHAQDLTLPGFRSLMSAVDHRFALSAPP
jgi:hypothetical protein